MALRGSTLPSAGLLSDLDLLANSELDLTSWLFQDDLYLPDFGRGAKNMHSISSAMADHASPSFITSQDFPDWMDASTDINWDQPLNLEECLNNDLKQQMQQQQTCSDEFQTKLTQNLLVDPTPYQRVSTHRVLVEKNDINDVAYSDDDLSSPEGFEDSCTSFNVLHESFSVHEEKPFQLSASPYIISVPLTEVFADQKPPAFKTINITGIERINVAQKPVFCSTSIQSVASSSLPNEQREPQKIVINLRCVTLPVINSSAPDVEVLEPVQPLPQSGPTLKEALSMDDADDFIRDMVSMPTMVPAQPFEADRQEDSVLQFSEDFEDSGFAEGCGSPSEVLLYSPSSSSSLDSACGSVHSLELYDGHSSQDDDIEEEDLLIHNKSPSSCAGHVESSRYAPYKSLEKKMRKKEQNKRAALRYRQKKKEEEDTVLGTLQAEEEKQKQLNEKYNALQMEVKLMKKLMREMLVTKGTLKNY